MKFTEGAFRDWGYNLSKEYYNSKDLDGGPWQIIEKDGQGAEKSHRDAAKKRHHGYFTIPKPRKAKRNHGCHNQNPRPPHNSSKIVGDKKQDKRTIFQNRTVFFLRWIRAIRGHNDAVKQPFC